MHAFCIWDQAGWTHSWTVWTTGAISAGHGTAPTCITWKRRRVGWYLFFSHDCTDPTPGQSAPAALRSDWYSRQVGRTDQCCVVIGLLMANFHWSVMNCVIPGIPREQEEEVCTALRSTTIWHLFLGLHFCTKEKRKQQKRDGANISNVFGSEKMRIILIPPAL